MAESQSEKVHYIVACPEVVSDSPTHIYAKNQEEAVRIYIEGDNAYGYDAESFDGWDVFVVPASQVTPYHIESTPGYVARKGTKGKL